MNRSITIIFSLFMIIRVYPQDSAWNYIPIPPDNPVTSLVESNNRLYISGVKGLFFTENDGKSWQQVSQPQNDFKSFNELSVTNKNRIIGSYNVYLPIPKTYYYISSDFGVSWQLINNERSFYNICGDSSGVLWGVSKTGISKSYDNGTSWEDINIEAATFTQIYISKKNHIFFIAKSGIYRSADDGVSWQKLTSGQDYNVFHIDIDGNYFAYMIGNGFKGLYISRDEGKTWERRCEYPPSDKDLVFDKFGNLFSLNQISTDIGKTWKNFLYPLPNTDFIKCTYQGTLYLGGQSSQGNGFLFKRNNNYVMPAQIKIRYPLNKGNMWQYKYVDSFHGYSAEKFEVKLINVKIISETVFNGQTYLMQSDYPDGFLYYSENDNKLHVTRGSDDLIRIDFTVPDGALSNSNSVNYNGIIGRVNRGIDPVLGLESPYFQIKEEYSYSSETYKYNSQLGLTKDSLSYYSMGNGSGEKVKTLIRAYIVEDGVAKYYSNSTAAPEIKFTPPQIITDSLLQINLNVTHEENVKINSLVKLSYIDSVYLSGYYKKNYNVIGNIKLLAEYLQGTEIFTVDTSLSDNLLRQGYDFYFKVVAIDKGLIPNRSYAPDSGYFCVKHYGAVDVKNTELQDPKEFRLNQNYPNPANPTTLISYMLPFESKVKIILYNSVGQQVQILVNDQKPAGSHNLLFDGSMLPSGVYFYNIQASGFSQTKKLILMK